MVGMIMMKRKAGTGIEVIMEGTGAGAEAVVETATGKGAGTGEETMGMRGVGSVAVITATGKERNDGALSSFLHCICQFL